MKKRELNKVMNEIYQGKVLEQLEKLTNSQREQVIMNMFASKEELTSPDVITNQLGIHIRYDVMREDILAGTSVTGEIGEYDENEIVLNYNLNGKQGFVLAYELINLLLNHPGIVFNYHHSLRDSYFCWDKRVLYVMGSIFLNLSNVSFQNMQNVEMKLEEWTEKRQLSKKLVKIYIDEYHQRRKEDKNETI